MLSYKNLFGSLALISAKLPSKLEQLRRYFILIIVTCVSVWWTNRWANNRDAGDLRRHRAHYDVNAMSATLNNWSISALPAGGERLCNDEPSERNACADEGITQEICQYRGCCYDASFRDEGYPSCFYKGNVLFWSLLLWSENIL